MKGTKYHESAIQYNTELAECAEDLMTRLEDEEVVKWANSVAKQHRFHEGRHKRALEKLKDSEEDHVVEEAAENPDTTVEEHMDAIPVEVPVSTEQDAEPVEN